MEALLTVYRKTIKPFRPAHVALHRVMSGVALPALEAAQRFKTIPDDPFWFRLELLTGRHEVETARLLAQLVRPGMTVLDIGAHVGYYAGRFARQVGESGRVIAVEPHPRTFEVLCANVARFGNVTPARVAVAEAAGEAELFDYLMMSASGSLHYDESLRELQKAHLGERDIAPRIHEDFPLQTYRVRTVPVDDLLDEVGIRRVDVVKMDIEGAEMGALRGMRRTLAQSPGLQLVMEYNPQALMAFGFAPLAALDEVLAMGFDQMQMIQPDGSLVNLTGQVAQLEQLTSRLMDEMGVVNVWFTRRRV